MAIFILVSQCLVAQDPNLQQKGAQIKEAMAANKQALSHYTWQEQQTVSIKGEVKKQQLFQVQNGPDGKPQKTLSRTSAGTAGAKRRKTQAPRRREEERGIQGLRTTDRGTGSVLRSTGTGTIAAGFRSRECHARFRRCSWRNQVSNPQLCEAERYRNNDLQHRRECNPGPGDRFLSGRSKGCRKHHCPVRSFARWHESCRRTCSSTA